VAAPGPADESTNSGGATISSVKGRRKREAAPAYDWGEPQDQQAGADDDESGRKISDALKGFFK
jgi:hypothetical protein